MLAHRLRRWASISPALGQRLVFAKESLRSLQSNARYYVGENGEVGPALD